MQRIYANGMALNLAYDPNGREVYRQLSNGAGVLLRQEPIYGRSGQMLSLTESGSAVGGSSTVVTFGYDDTYQLTVEERAGYSSYFGYDGAGNRLLQVENGVVTSYAYDSANQQVQSRSGTSVSNSTFDANGNLAVQNAGGALTSYTWDEENRLVGAQEAGGALSTYLYSQDGERRLAQTATGNTRFVWDGVNLLQEREAASGVLLRHYSDFPGTWGGLTSVAQGNSPALFNAASFNATRFNDSGGGVVSHFFGPDVQGNVRLLTDAAGNQSDGYSLSAFGKLLASTGNTVNPFIFGGEFGYFTDELARLYVRARYYDPITGRWFSFDPIGFAGGDANLYRYVNNSPVDGVDPSGLVTRGEVVYNWYFEADRQDTRIFGPENKVTRDVMKLAKVKSCLEAYASHGCPGVHEFPTKSQGKLKECYFQYGNAHLPTDIPIFREVALRLTYTNHSALLRGLTRSQYKNEVVTSLNLFRTEFVLGSFSVKIYNAGKCKLRYVVKNTSSWESALRLPGDLQRLLRKPSLGAPSKYTKRNYRLDNTFSPKSYNGFGGNYKQIYTWFGLDPCCCYNVKTLLDSLDGRF